MKLYHYTSREKLAGIAGDDVGYGLAGGLRPRRRFIPLGPGCRDLPEKATDGAVFGLLDPLDPAWCVNDYHPGVPLLETVLGDIDTDRDGQLYLLEATLTADDDAHVADHGPHLRLDYQGRRDSPPQILRAVKHAYWHSLTPVADYPCGAPHVLAEVVCFTPIPLARLRCVGVFDKAERINEVRAIGGYPPHPVRPAPDPAAMDAAFAALFLE